MDAYKSVGFLPGSNYITNEKRVQNNDIDGTVWDTLLEWISTQFCTKSSLYGCWIDLVAIFTHDILNKTVIIIGLVYKSNMKDVHDNLSNPSFEKKVRGQKHPREGDIWRTKSSYINHIMLRQYCQHQHNAIIRRYFTLRRFHVTEIISIGNIMIENRRVNQMQSNYYVVSDKLWLVLSDKWNIVNLKKYHYKNTVVWVQDLRRCMNIP